MQYYPTTQRIINNFIINEDKKIIIDSINEFKILILDESDTFKLNSSKKEIKLLSNEGLITPIGEIEKNNFRITSSFIKDIFGLILFKKSIPTEKIDINNFNIEKIIEIAIKYFDFDYLINCYQFCFKDNKELETLVDIGLKECVFQFELGSIFRNWFQNNINIYIQAKKDEKEKKYPDIFLYCSKFKIILELLSNERFGPDNRDSSVLGHIKRTINYFDLFKADNAWIINFVCIKDINYFDKLKYPEENKYNVNIVYIIYDKYFKNIKMKFTKINEKTKSIDIKISTN